MRARIETYRVVAKSIREDPFIGVGMDLKRATKPFPIFSYEYDVHNLVIATWYKGGIFALAGILTALFAVARVGWAAVRSSTTTDERAVAVSLFAGLVAFIVLAMGSPILFVRYGWVSAARLLALRVVQEDEAGAYDEVPPGRELLAIAPSRP